MSQSNRPSSERARVPYEAPRATPVRLDPTRELLQSTGCGLNTTEIPGCDPNQGGTLTGA